MPVLERARLDFALRQAAVWIVTVNAGYDDLGRIKFVIENFPRVIDERAAARAMRLCDEAGIDITRKAIWKDRQQIIAGLEDSDLKAWLNQKK
jgi:hypothetical protein